MRHAGGRAPAAPRLTPLPALAPLRHARARPPQRQLLLRYGMPLHRGLLPRGIGVGVGLDPLEPALRGGGPGRELRVRVALPAGGGRGGRGLRRGRRPQALPPQRHRHRRRLPCHGRAQVTYMSISCAIEAILLKGRKMEEQILTASVNFFTLLLSSCYLTSSYLFQANVYPST
uniref:Uncharacterized protein n=1 Tax=Triticum urartu TaxID=4572 RepID=A0A8R7TNI9_TRIUA